MNLLNQPFYSDSVIFWAYSAIILSIILGLSLYTRFFWNIRVAITAVTSCLIGISLGLLFVSDLSFLVVVTIITTQIYRLFSLFRIVENRINDLALRNKTLRTEIFMSAILLATLVAEFFGYIDEYGYFLVLLLASVQFIFAFLFFQHVRTVNKTSKITLPESFRADAELPSITVAIPARNETKELNDCLDSILRTNYPKLEVLVLDDCSQDNTPEVIKQFAHKGVRFLSGKKPPNSWLAKNYAYHQLLDEAGGKYIIFCGTDVRFDSNSIRILIENVLEKDAQMISVVPTRLIGLDRRFLLQPMRYWRELAIPKLFDKSPPVLSTCWAVDRNYLSKSGGFTASKKTIRPERIIGKNISLNGKYSFVRSSSGLGISSQKTLSSQWLTAIRTRYPELKNRPENIFFASLMYGLVFLGAPSMMIVGLVHTDFTLLSMGILSTIFILISHSYIHFMTNGKISIVNILLFPISVLLEIIAINYSMWAYEFSKVTWKGRNVCQPVLATASKLPEIQQEA